MKSLKEIKEMLSEVTDDYREYWGIYREVVQYLISFPINNVVLSDYLDVSHNVFDYVLWYAKYTESAPYELMCKRLVRACDKIKRVRLSISDCEDIPLLFVLVTPLLSRIDITEVARLRKYRYNHNKRISSDELNHIHDKIITYAKETSVIHDATASIIERYQDLDASYRRIHVLTKKIQEVSKYISNPVYIEHCKQELECLNAEYKKVIDSITDMNDDTVVAKLASLEKDYARIYRLLDSCKESDELKKNVEHWTSEVEELSEDIIFDVNYINRMIGYQLIEIVN